MMILPGPPWAKVEPDPTNKPVPIPPPSAMKARWRLFKLFLRIGRFVAGMFFISFELTESEFSPS